MALSFTHVQAQQVLSRGSKDKPEFLQLAGFQSQVQPADLFQQILWTVEPGLGSEGFRDNTISTGGSDAPIPS